MAVLSTLFFAEAPEVSLDPFPYHVLGIVSLVGLASYAIYQRITKTKQKTQAEINLEHAIEHSLVSCGLNFGIASGLLHVFGSDKSAALLPWCLAANVIAVPYVAQKYVNWRFGATQQAPAIVSVEKEPKHVLLKSVLMGAGIAGASSIVNAVVARNDTNIEVDPSMFFTNLPKCLFKGVIPAAMIQHTISKCVQYPLSQLSDSSELVNQLYGSLFRMLYFYPYAFESKFDWRESVVSMALGALYPYDDSKFSYAAFLSTTYMVNHAFELAVRTNNDTPHLGIYSNVPLAILGGLLAYKLVEKGKLLYKKLQRGMEREMERRMPRSDLAQ